MNLRSFVEQLKKRYMPEVSSTDILGYINDVYQEMYSQNNDNFLWRLPYPIEDITGYDNFSYPRLSDDLEIHNNISQYIDIDTTNLVTDKGFAISSFEFKGIDMTSRKVAYLFCDSSYVNEDTYDALSGVYPDLGNVDNKWAIFPIHAIDGNSESPAKVKLLSLPLEGVKMYVMFYIQVPDITSVNNSTLLNLSKDKKLITDGVVGLYEDVVNGRSERLDRYNAQLPIWASDYNSLGNNTYVRVFPSREIG